MSTETQSGQQDWTVNPSDAVHVFVCSSSADADHIRTVLPFTELGPTAIVACAGTNFNGPVKGEAVVVVFANEAATAQAVANSLKRPVGCHLGGVVGMNWEEVFTAFNRAPLVDPAAPDLANPTASPSDTSAPRIYQINGKPALRLPGVGRPLGEFAAECGELLAEQNIFARKGCAFTLDPEGQKLEPATPTWLRSWAEKFVCCFKVKVTGSGEIHLATTMTDDAARVVLQAPQFLERLRPVERFNPCRLPVLRPSGQIELLPEGYDRDSATYTAPGSSYPLDTSIAEALAVVAEVYAEFPFAEDGGRSKAVAISALLTVFASGLMPVGATRPVFIFLANAEGTGKTTCARVAGIAYGAVAAEAAPGDEPEWQKKILAVVIAGRHILLLDNVKGFLNSPSLEAYTSAALYGGRILGLSKQFEGEACATVLITGNRLTISPDMRRRSLTVELFMHELRAEDRRFDRRLDDPGLLAMRPRLLAACWALVRAWDGAGRPVSSRQNSSFPRWCDTIAGIVEHAGFACPTVPAEIEGMGDTDTGDIAKLAERLVPSTPYTFAELVDVCAEGGLFERFTNTIDADGELIRQAKSAFAKTLKGYDRRQVTPSLKFFLVGAGKSRRFLTK